MGGGARGREERLQTVRLRLTTNRTRFVQAHIALGLMGELCAALRRLQGAPPSHWSEFFHQYFVESKEGDDLLFYVPQAATDGTPTLHIHRKHSTTRAPPSVGFGAHV